MYDVWDVRMLRYVQPEDGMERKEKGNPKTPSPITLGYSKLWDLLANPCPNRLNGCRRQSSCRLRITAAVMDFQTLFRFETPSGHARLYVYIW